ncbi:MAG: glycosyltransferase [Ignisphaera sp.]
MIQIMVDSAGYSFRKVALITSKGLYSIGLMRINMVNIHIPLSFNPFMKTVIIGDTIFLLQSQLRRFVFFNDVAIWADSPLEIQPFDTDCCIYTCLPYWARFYRDIGIDVDGWIPRPVDMDIADSVVKASCEDLVKKYGDYIVTVGSDLTTYGSLPPRKGLDMFDRLCSDMKSIGIRCVAVTNWMLRNAYTIRFGSLDEFELMRLIKCAKLFVWTSRSEGFGMPPIEAMAVGQIVVSSNAPFNDLVVGVKFDYSDLKSVTVPFTSYRYMCWDYSYRDLYDAVTYALSMDEDERAKISEKARESARLLDKSFIAQAIMEVLYRHE